MSRILIMAGGTGGHVFPALAVARHLLAQGHAVVWLGTQRGLESRVVPAAGLPLDTIAIRGLRGTGLLNWLLLPLRMLVAMIQSWQVLRRHRPDAVLAMGGFVAGPGGLVARLRRTALLVHEQNAIAGMTNRWLANFAHIVMAGFPEAFGERAGVRHVGNPVRDEILNLPPPEQRLERRHGALHLLVVGGSQGARIFNQIVPAAIQQLPDGARPEVWHQTGRSEEAATAARYATFTDSARVAAFIDDMAEAYRWADVVVCRAGAMTIAELAAAGVAAILVPFPQAVDDHQTANARFLSSRHAAILLPQKEFSAERLAEILLPFIRNRELVLQMSQRARACAVTDATEQVARLCLEAVHA